MQYRNVQCCRVEAHDLRKRSDLAVLVVEHVVDAEVVARASEPHSERHLRRGPRARELIAHAHLLLELLLQLTPLALVQNRLCTRALHSTRHYHEQWKCDWDWARRGRDGSKYPEGHGHVEPAVPAHEHLVARAVHELVRRQPRDRHALLAHNHTEHHVWHTELRLSRRVVRKEHRI